jgi:hypothetical protein
MKLCNRLIRSGCDGVDGAGGYVLVGLGYWFRLLFYGSLDYRRALAELAGRNGIDAVRG